MANFSRRIISALLALTTFAPLLAQEGVAVAVVAQKMPDELKAQPARDAAIEALKALVSAGALVVGPDDEIPLNEDGSLAQVPVVLVGGTFDQYRCLIHRAHLVVDAVMGTGSKAPREPFGTWIAATNLSIGNHATLAVDIPSGVYASDGSSAATRIIADETITMIVPKPGLVARECGKLTVAPLAYIEPYV